MTAPPPASPFLGKPRVAENALAFALRDPYPVSPGHTLVVPKRVVPTFAAATPRERAAMLALVHAVRGALARELSPASRRFHEIRRVVSDLGVFDFETPDNRMRLRSVHPGVTAEQIVEKSGFELVIPADVPESRLPTEAELALLRERIDPNGSGAKEVPG